MSAVERVNKAWDRIEAWYKKNLPGWKPRSGASDTAIDALAKHMKVTFPEELRVSLKRHNGIEDLKWPGGSLLSLVEIQMEWDTWTEMARAGEFDDERVESDGTFQPKRWCEAWIPIDSDGGGNCNMMDLAPGSKGRIGQMLYFDHEKGPEKSEYPDYPGYLEAIADGFEKGRYSVDDDAIIDNEADGEEGEDDDDDEEEDYDEEEEEDEEEDEEEEKSKLKKKVKK